MHLYSIAFTLSLESS